MAHADEKKELDIEMQEAGDESVKFIQPHANGSLVEPATPRIEFSGLTKEELAQYANDPFWKKVRWVLFIAFWIVWIGMLVAAVIIIVMAPKCPQRHKQEFWEKKVGYWVDPFAFKDSNGDKIGDFKGILEKIDYIKNDVKSGYIILDSIFKGQFNEENNQLLGEITDFKEIDPALGTFQDLKRLIKEARKKEIEIVLTIDPLSVSKNYTSLANFFLKELPSDWKTIQGKSTSVDCGNSKKLYSSFGGKCVILDLDLTKTKVVEEFQEIVSFWAKQGVRGFLFTNVPLYGKDATLNTILDDAVPHLKAGQVYQNSSLQFLTEIRKTLKGITANSDKSMLLIADSGNLGFGSPADQDRNSMYKGAVDLVVSTEFLRNRGWRYDTTYRSSRVENYAKNIENGSALPSPKMALTTATPYNLRTTYLPSIGASHLLPGAAIVYFGSEIADSSDENTQKMDDFESGSFTPKYYANYPQGKRTLSYTQLNSSDPVTAFDIVNRYSMNWDNGRSTNDSTYKNSVVRMTAAGRGDTLFHLYSNLATLRQKPSFLWGSFELLESTENREIFVRSAEKFPTYIVALIHDGVKDSGNEQLFLRFTDVCDKVTPALLYPANAKLPKKVEISTKSIMIPNKESINVFKCV